MEVTTHEHDGPSKMKQRFVAARRKIKDIDLRKTVVDNPFTAVGIGLAVGALVGLIRPKPRPGRISSAFFAAAGTLTYRLIRDAAIVELGRYAGQLFDNLKQEQPATSDAPF